MAKKIDYQLTKPGGFVRASNRKITVPGSWPGLSAFQECDMQHAIKVAGLRQAHEAERMEIIRRFVIALRGSHPHTAQVRLGKLVFWIQALGSELIQKLASNNLSTFTFQTAVEKELLKRS